MGNTSSRPEISGDFAHDAADTTGSNPVKIGGIAKDFDGTDPGNVAENDRVQALFRREGIAAVEIGHPYSFQTTLSYAGATTAAAPIITSPATGTAIYITDIVFSSDTSGAMSLVNRVTASAITLVNARIQANGGMWAHSFRNPIRAGTADTTTAVPNVGLTTGMTTTTAVITGFFAP